MTPDHRTITIVVVLVGLLAVCGMIGLLALTWADKPVPESIPPLVGMAFGALTGMLTSTRVGRVSDGRKPEKPEGES